jgi:hypothetical protein
MVMATILLDNNHTFFHDILNMNDLPFKTPSLQRSYLETLATHELIRLADSFGIDIPPDLERLFIIAELMDTTADNALGDGGLGKHEGISFMETAIPEPVSLPKHYNITFIEVMIRDSLWAFTFWEIKAHDKELYEKTPDFAGYHLKVSPVSVSGAARREDSFIIPVGSGDTAWYIGFPPEGGRFKVDICVLRGEEEVVLASSHPFTLPRLFNPPNRRDSEELTHREAFYSNPLIRLSGVEDFQVLRNTDRRSRIKWESDS